MKPRLGIPRRATGSRAARNASTSHHWVSTTFQSCQSLAAGAGLKDRHPASVEMNKISLVAAVAATTAFISSPGGAKATILSVAQHCDANSGGVLPFTWHYKATITGGNFIVDWVSPGGAEVHIRGTIPPNGGETVLQMTGTTGNSKFTTDMLPHGSPLSFPIVATFGPPPRFAGTGYRNDNIRQCQLTFQ
jgi:hypothetical protein